MSDLVRQAYDPEHFRRQGHQLIDLLADYFTDLQSGDTNYKVLEYVPPADLYERWQADLEQAPHPDELVFYKTMLHDTIHAHHPHYLGHQTSVVSPMAALAELLGSALDPGMGVYEQGNSGVVLERLLSKKLGALIGWDDRCDGFMTSGGTLGNLTALLCARQTMIGGDVWKNGYQGKQYGFLVSSEAHYSVARAIQVMGMGSKGVVSVPVDARYCLRPEMLEECLGRANDQGIEVIGAVANACSTTTGSYDPIGPIADFCEAKKLWLHVDGAHGACVLFSQKYKHLVEGIHRADSVIMDFHKMLMTPKLITSVLFKNAEHSYHTFSQKAYYMWDKDEGHEWYNLGKRTFELTKSFMSIRVYALWRTYGEEVFAKNVDNLYDLAKIFTRYTDEQPDFETVLSDPPSNIICFRLVGNGWPEEKTERVNLAIRERLVREGRFFIVQSRVQGRLFLRSTIINPFTTLEHWQGLLEEIRRLGEE